MGISMGISIIMDSNGILKNRIKWNVNGILQWEDLWE
jgi:hypothetical protein